MTTPVPRYTFLAFELAHLLDEDKRLDPDQTRSRLANGSFMEWLEETFPDEIDLSLYAPEERRRSRAPWPPLLTP